LVFINQIRMKIGVMFGSPETTTGGQALKFYSSARIDIRRIGAIKNGDAVVGNRTRVKVVKNKLAPPFRQAEVEIRFGEGICRNSDLLDRGLDAGILSRSGSWHSWGETRMGQGREAARQWLREHEEDAKRLRAELFATVLAVPKDHTSAVA
jgi:recombination protein RecA